MYTEQPRVATHTSKESIYKQLHKKEQSLTHPSKALPLFIAQRKWEMQVSWTIRSSKRGGAGHVRLMG